MIIAFLFDVLPLFHQISLNPLCFFRYAKKNEQAKLKHNLPREKQTYLIYLDGLQSLINVTCSYQMIFKLNSTTMGLFLSINTVSGGNLMEEFLK